MALKNRGAAKTKDALADAMLGLLLSDHPLAKIRVKQLTDACEVDRQTFYYYFKNTTELAEYTYQREVEKLLANKGIDNIQELSWKTRIASTMEWLDEHPSLRKMILPSQSDRALRSEIKAMIFAELERDYLPYLLETKIDEAQARERTRFISSMLEALLMDWLSGEIQERPADILDRVEEMLRDYTTGVSVRLGK